MESNNKYWNEWVNSQNRKNNSKHKTTKQLDSLERNLDKISTDMEANKIFKFGNNYNKKYSTNLTNSTFIKQNFNQQNLVSQFIGNQQVKIGYVCEYGILVPVSVQVPVIVQKYYK